tara:strand:+ start:383 stop:847 length:465 start_codon:yes stop_codon:yes gene_type:complete
MHHQEEEEYDDFFRRGRKKARRKIRRRVKKNLTSAKSETNRMKTQSKHKNVLNKLKDRGFLANSNNQGRVYNQVKKMAIEIDDLASELIAKRKRCVCDKKGLRRRKSNFDGYNADGSQQSMLGNIWENHKVPLLIGGALIFFFVTPYGKRIVGK